MPRPSTAGDIERVARIAYERTPGVLNLSRTVFGAGEHAMSLGVVHLYDTSSDEVAFNLPTNPKHGDPVGVKEFVIDSSFTCSVVAPDGALVENPYSGSKDPSCSFYGGGGVGTCIVWQAYRAPGTVIWIVERKTPYII